MGWWFGRKSAPADARPFVPAWLRNDAAEEGFARSPEGATVYVRSTGTRAAFRNDAWEVGQVRGAALIIGDEQVVGSRSEAISSPSGGTTIDSEARASVNSILDALRQHGLIET